MKLNELMTKPLQETLKDMDVTSLKPITNDKGEVMKIIIEYEPREGC